jgi:hypothetical protein
MEADMETKRIVAVMLVMVMALGLTGCGKKSVGLDEVSKFLVRIDTLVEHYYETGVIGDAVRDGWYELRADAIEKWEEVKAKIFAYILEHLEDIITTSIKSEMETLK